jgi:hypothetical protein
MATEKPLICVALHACRPVASHEIFPPDVDRRFVHHQFMGGFMVRRRGPV